MMSERVFSPRCARSRQRSMRLETFHYGIRIDHDGRKHEVEIPDFSAPKCSHCGELSIDEAASQQIDSAFRRQAGLLTPVEIR